MEAPFRLNNVTIEDNVFTHCTAPAPPAMNTECNNETHIPLGYWCRWVMYAPAGAVESARQPRGATQLDDEACTGIMVERNNNYVFGRAGVAPRIV